MTGRRARRAVLFGAVGGALGLWVVPAWAGTYLNRAALLLSEARREADYLRSRFADKELARIVHRMAEARLSSASSMMVPREVAQAHPHLLLVLENYERAADAAVRGEAEQFLVYCHRAQDEERTFRAVLKQLGWELPSA
jgi:hypothetical protein